MQSPAAGASLQAEVLQQGGAGAINRNTLPYIFLSSASSLPLSAHTHTEVTVPQVAVPGCSIFSGVIIPEVCSAESDTTAPSPKAGSC